MSAYVVMVRRNTKDPAGLEQYAALARLAPTSKIELVASSKLSPMQVLEGPPTDAVVVLRFPQMSDALEWYKSPEYQKALPHRQAVADYQAYLLEGVS